MTIKHRRARSREWIAWKNAKCRCRTKTHQAYANYGGRGITFAAAWDDFSVFFADMGLCPEGHQLDRIDNSRGYEPGNCRWTTSTQNNRNRRSTRLVPAFGETKPVVQWAEERGLSPELLLWRLNRGWSPELAIGTPVRPMKKRSA